MPRKVEPAQIHELVEVGSTQFMMPVEQMLLRELANQRNQVVAPIQAKIDAALRAIAERVGCEADEMVVNIENGAITIRPTVMSNGHDIEEVP